MADKVAVLIPCYNEAVTIGKGGGRLQARPARRRHLRLRQQPIRVRRPVSTSPIVKFEAPRGAGNVVRSMFRDIDADYYLMVDGDDTSCRGSAGSLSCFAPRQLNDGGRPPVRGSGEENDRASNVFGNDLVQLADREDLRLRLRRRFTGYRVQPRVREDHVRATPRSFQIETEISIHAVDKRAWRIEDVPIDYRDHRPEGSYSKLSTFGDGAKGAAHHESVQGLLPAGVLRLAGPDLAGAGRGGGHPRRCRVRGHRPGAPHPPMLGSLALAGGVSS